MNSQTKAVNITGAVGTIECLIDGVNAQDAKGSVVISHPHPLFEGSMHNKVVQTIARAYVQQGWQAIRFNFRGVGASEGQYDKAIGETDDLLAVINALVVKKPLALAGFSFGTVVTLNLLQRQLAELEILALTLVGVPAKNFSPLAVPQQLRSNTLVVHGQIDDVAPIELTLNWARPQKQPITVVPDVGHFFHGNLPLLKALIVNQVKALC